ncbi:MAG: response regulator [Ruminococcus flavefaciens]|nr:response regulator [Ruminococcus flavefaciens]MCM1229336.1 response regulator [Ruminococcus flavefaciens]
MADYAEILIVDDMPDQIAYSGTLLRAEGYRVFATTSGKGVMRFLEGRIPDLILLDIQLGDTNGLEICRMIKANPKTSAVPIIFLTSETSPEIISRSFELGGCDYVKKPFIKEEYLARIRTHLQIALQQRDLTNANNELTMFCSAVSHDLKAPFNIINMLIEMLRSELGENQEQGIYDIMGMIVSKATQTRIMIERLFEFSKMCNVKPKMKPVDIREITAETFRELHGLEAERDIEFICGDLPTVDGDEVLIRIMMKNLLGNAIKYTSKRKKAVIEVSGSVNNTYNVIKIKDNGSGFDMTYANKLFQVFQRLHSEEEFEGSGVGLALVNRIMERHGGKVEAYGEVDKGAEFSLLFPKKQYGEQI